MKWSGISIQGLDKNPLLFKWSCGKGVRGVWNFKPNYHKQYLPQEIINKEEQSPNSLVEATYAYANFINYHFLQLRPIWNG